MISLFSVLTLTDGSYRELLPSLVVTSLSYIINSAFLTESRQRSVLPTLPSFARCIDCLAPRVIFVLVLGALARVSFIGFPPSNAISSLLLGITKSLSWTYTAQSVSVAFMTETQSHAPND